MGDQLSSGAVGPDDRALLAELGRRHRLWSAAEVATLVARGAENTTFAVGRYIVRRCDDLAAVSHEVDVLTAMAQATTVPTPEPVLYEPDLGTFAYRRLPGTPLLHRARRDLRSIQPALVDALAALRRIRPVTPLPVDHHPNEEWHSDAVQAFRVVRGHLGTERERLVRAFLDQPVPPTRTAAVAQHNDLGAEHILVDDRGAVTGIIDWTDAALTDPARDIGSLYRDLGPDAAVGVGEALNGPLTDDEVRRIRFHARCRWLEDVAYGIAEPMGRRPYLDNAWSTFDHTFSARHERRS